MKHFLLLGLLATATAAQAQITFEHKYPVQVDAYKLSTGDVKYAAFIPGTANQVRVYNANHSLFRQITVPVSAGNADLSYMSDKLFNNTAGLEFILNYRNSTTQVDVTKVFDETGATLLTADSCSFVRIVNTPQGTKLITYQQSPSTGLTYSYSKVYGLSGTLTALKTLATSSADVAQPYPNPATELVQLPYTISRGLVGTLTVANMAGQIVSTYQVDGTFDHLLFDARKVRPGIYVYRVETAAGTSTGRKFMVQ